MLLIQLRYKTPVCAAPRLQDALHGRFYSLESADSTGVGRSRGVMLCIGSTGVPDTMHNRPTLSFFGFVVSCDTQNICTPSRFPGPDASVLLPFWQAHEGQESRCNLRPTISADLKSLVKAIVQDPKEQNIFLCARNTCYT